MYNFLVKLLEMNKVCLKKSLVLICCHNSTAPTTTTPEPTTPEPTTTTTEPTTTTGMLTPARSKDYTYTGMCK